MSLNEIISISISVLALLLSLYSVIKTNHFNKYQLIIKDTSFEIINGYIRIKLNIFNNSNKSIEINKIIFLDNNVEINPINFDIDKYYEQLRQISRPKSQSINVYGFNLDTSIYSRIPQIAHYDEYPSKTKGIIIAPNTNENFTYYFSEKPRDFMINIESNQKLSFFKKSKKYSINLVESV